MSFLKKVWKAAKKAVRTVVWVANRIGSIFELGLSLLHFRPKKKIRIRGWILTFFDEKNNRVYVAPAHLVEDMFVKASVILQREANVVLEPDGGGIFSSTASDGAPGGALTPACSISLLHTDAEEYYDLHSTTGLFAIRVFIVKGYSTNSSGCSWPVFTNIATVQFDSPPDTLAHEIGHLCGLFHRNNEKRNLMCTLEAGRTATNLTNWQVSVLRTSEYTSWL